MQYALPKFRPTQINAAGRALIAPSRPGRMTAEEFDQLVETYIVVNNWRACHARPLGTFAVTLKNRALKIHKESLVAQRIKRLDSITRKLQIQSTMNLSQMQDIAGCRAIMPTIAHVRRLEKRYGETTDFSHEFKSCKDYIAEPKASGYRGIHLIYRFKLRNSSPYEGQQVEIQLRSKLQHVWATAVEAAGTFTNQALKSSQGSVEWQRFFALMSSYIAQLERAPLVPDTPKDMEELRRELRINVTKLHVIGTLQTYNATLNAVDRKAKVKYYLMDLDPEAMTVNLTTFAATQNQEANEAYTDTEKALPKDSTRQVVLVSVDSIQALRQAYPNYFLDTTRFVELVEEAIADTKANS